MKWYYQNLFTDTEQQTWKGLDSLKERKQMEHALQMSGFLNCRHSLDQSAEKKFQKKYSRRKYGFQKRKAEMVRVCRTNYPRQGDDREDIPRTFKRHAPLLKLWLNNEINMQAHSYRDMFEVPPIGKHLIEYPGNSMNISETPRFWTRTKLTLQMYYQCIKTSFKKIKVIHK